MGIVKAEISLPLTNLEVLSDDGIPVSFQGAVLPQLHGKRWMQRAL